MSVTVPSIETEQTVFTLNPFEGMTSEQLDEVAKSGEPVFTLDEGGVYSQKDVVIPKFIPGGWRARWMTREKLVLMPGSVRCIDIWLAGQINVLMSHGYTKAQAEQIMDLRELSHKLDPKVSTAVLDAMKDSVQRQAWQMHWQVNPYMTKYGDNCWVHQYGKCIPHHLSEPKQIAVAEILRAIG